MDVLKVLKCGKLLPLQYENYESIVKTGLNIRARGHKDC